MKTTIKISQTSKLGARSWSLQAVDTCPGSRGADGNLVAACSGCYATTGAYVWSTTIAPRASNKEDWKRDEWVSDMVSALKKDKKFRFFDSGDMYHIGLAKKILQVIEQSPNTKFWVPTRMYKFAKFQGILDKINALPNAVVRFSSDSVIGEYNETHGSTIISDDSQVTDDMYVCRAYNNGGKCGPCEECWNKDTKLIAYKAHGHKIKKVIKLVLEA